MQLRPRVEGAVRVSAGKVQRASDALSLGSGQVKATRQMTLLRDFGHQVHSKHLRWAKHTDAIQRGHSFVSSTSLLG